MERLFGLDAQLIFDAVVLGLSMLVLFTLLSYLLFNPVRDMLEKRKQRILDEHENAKREREEAEAYREEYEKKMKEIHKEAEAILDNTRKKALKSESQIVADAKQEATRIKERASAEIELEKTRAMDGMKQEVITIASMMAEKVVSAAIDTDVQDDLIDETLKEMGESTWQN